MSDETDEVHYTREYVQADRDVFGLTEHFLKDPVLRRRLVRTQIEEPWTLYWHYPMEELDAVRQTLERLRHSYRHVEPFNHPMLAELGDVEDDDE
jgi:hypothetical protein